jgi:hypothetical protein
VLHEQALRPREITARQISPNSLNKLVALSFELRITATLALKTSSTFHARLPGCSFQSNLKLNTVSLILYQPGFLVDAQPSIDSSARTCI